ncbi:MAG: HNH endonuclease, partial [Moheibacter sp.]
GGKKLGKEVVEEIGEQAVKKNLDDIAEAGGKKTAKELAEAAAKKKGPPGKVVTKEADELAENKLDDLATKIPEWKGPTDYSNIDISRFKIKEGGNFTPAQKKAIYEANMKHNDGLLRSDLDGTVLEKPKKSESGITPPKNEAQVDHINPKSKGGTNDPSSNAQILSREQNRAKWDN